jgi:hypothetical protein
LDEGTAHYMKELGGIAIALVTAVPQIVVVPLLSQIIQTMCHCYRML